MKKILTLFLTILFLGMNSEALAFVDINKIEITKNQIPLNSKLKKRYSGYEYIIKNNDKYKINVLNAQILNGNDGNIAFNTVEQGSGGAIGTVWAICGPTGLFTFGLGWLAGVVATPIAWLVANNSDKRANIESVSYTNIVPIGYIGSGEIIHVKTLVPIGSVPQIKISILDEKTKELYQVVQ